MTLLEASGRALYGEDWRLLAYDLAPLGNRNFRRMAKDDRDLTRPVLRTLEQVVRDRLQKLEQALKAITEKET